MYESKERSVGMVILLSFVTCGLYLIYWLFKTSQELQEAANEDESLSPAIELLLIFVTCGLYTYYWFYKYGKKIYKIQLDKNIVPADDNAILYLILAIFGLSIVSIAIMQSSINKTWTNQLEA